MKKFKISGREVSFLVIFIFVFGSAVFMLNNLVRNKSNADYLYSPLAGRHHPPPTAIPYPSPTAIPYPSATSCKLGSSNDVQSVVNAAKTAASSEAEKDGNSVQSKAQEVAETERGSGNAKIDSIRYFYANGSPQLAQSLANDYAQDVANDSSLSIGAIFAGATGASGGSDKPLQGALASIVNSQFSRVADHYHVPVSAGATLNKQFNFSVNLTPQFTNLTPGILISGTLNYGARLSVTAGYVCTAGSGSGDGSSTRYLTGNVAVDIPVNKNFSIKGTAGLGGDSGRYAHLSGSFSF